MSTLTFENNLERHRYETFDDGKLAAYSEYNLLSDSIMFTHTEVLPEHEGKGVGSFTAHSALDDARRQGKYVIPVCQFIAAWMRKHHEYIDLVKPDMRTAFKI
jgi:predicted GNAT family acetyltransferase